MFQEIIIAVIGVTVLAVLGWKVYCFFTKPAETCCNCTGCALADNCNKKTDKCPTYKTPTN